MSNVRTIDRQTGFLLPPSEHTKANAQHSSGDRDMIAAFRRRFLREIEGLFITVLMLAREIGVFKLGTVALDGTKIHANASRHSASARDA